MQYETILFSNLKCLCFHPHVFLHMTGIKGKVKKLFGVVFLFFPQFCFSQLRMVRLLACLDFSPSYAADISQNLHMLILLLFAFWRCSLHPALGFWKADRCEPHHSASPNNRLPLNGFPDGRLELESLRQKTEHTLKGKNEK